ncbi:CAF17-like 4Fe-4S cluster assembly/insertion protein YgfZ [Roseimaritima ulvae]|uniref:CAF17-like 4Fe-4S cluster assembly/insertion protein YgfZ n=1 Tax=Roseimaritima ulvae TaxID=980254 RepID=UPI0008320821|nr:hypothetical protein [Roseimaritima ulvae]
MLYLLPDLTVLDIIGADAVQILNNLCTADLKLLPSGGGVETFVTEVRGRTLGHGCLYSAPDRLRIIGAGDQAETLSAHIDRYTIREDAQPEDVSEAFCKILISGKDADRLAQRWGLSPGSPPHLSVTAGPQSVADLMVYQVPWTGPADWLCLAPAAVREALLAELAELEMGEADALDFHAHRIAAGFPWYGVDLDHTNLPQEADRNDAAISFTKGCYLGQETVARLDALGQVQKKLVRWQVQTTAPIAAGTALTQDGKNVGKITSTVTLDDHTLALGYARRSHFDAGSHAECDGAAAIVLP